jgi:PUA domain protein
MSVSHKTRRYALKSSEIKLILAKASEKLGSSITDFLDSKSNVEAIETSKGELLLVNRKPLLFKTGESVYPTLMFEQILSKLPKVVVDMGAIRHVCNGADVMAPGIVRYEGAFVKDALVLVVDLKHGKALALGEIQYDSESVKNVSKGVVVKNLHFVSDDLWSTLKTVGE